MAAYSEAVTAAPEFMLVWLHGDTSAGGPAMSHVRPAKEAAKRFRDKSVLSIALWRPGYSDSDGRQSSGDNFDRSDNLTDYNITVVGDVILNLIAFYRPAHTILIGHSGGAATAAVLLGKIPTSLVGAVLVSCPCDLRKWRSGRRWWPRSEDPQRWASRVYESAKIIAMTGTVDENTSPDLAIDYVRSLHERGVQATFIPIPGAPHNGALQYPQVMEAIASLLDDVGAAP